MLNRKMFSVLAAVGAAAPVMATLPIPVAHASAAADGQPAPEAGDTPLLISDGFAMMQGHTWTFAPLRDDLPAGTTLTLDEGEALAALRADGWSISVTDNMLTVSPPQHVEGRHQIPVIVTFPDQTTRTAFVTMHVDYLVDIPLSVGLPVLSYLHATQSSTSSTMP